MRYPIDVFYADHQEVILPDDHRFPMHKYRALHDALLERSVLRPEQMRKGPSVTVEQLCLAHDPAYVRAFLEGTLAPKVARRIGIPWSEALVARVRAAIGGTVAAAFAALEVGFSGNIAGGTHHAQRGHGEGFCVFNDIAVALEVLRHKGVVRRAAVVDLDVHQGNGTAAMMQHVPEVFTLSIHGAKNYPFRKVPSSLDIGLPDGTGDDAYMRHLVDALDAVFAHEPEVIFYQAGVDPLADDKLGRLALTHEGLRERDWMVLMASYRRGIPVVMTMGGGYADPIGPTIDAHVHTYEVVREIYG